MKMVGVITNEGPGECVTIVQCTVYNAYGKKQCTANVIMLTVVIISGIGDEYTKLIHQQLML